MDAGFPQTILKRCVKRCRGCQNKFQWGFETLRVSVGVWGTRVCSEAYLRDQSLWSPCWTRWEKVNHVSLVLAPGSCGTFVLFLQVPLFYSIRFCSVQKLNRVIVIKITCLVVEHVQGSDPHRTPFLQNNNPSLFIIYYWLFGLPDLRFNNPSLFIICYFSLFICCIAYTDLHNNDPTLKSRLSSLTSLLLSWYHTIITKKKMFMMISVTKMMIMRMTKM